MLPEMLPAIICLHGHGSNAAIFQYQSRKITQVLGTRFRFLFIDSPITTPQPGVGVLPYFATVKPYRRWHQDANTIGLFDVTPEDIDRERRLVRDNLAEVIERERQNGPGIVGVMAFSQGARVATALCLDPELGVDIKFAIMICGVCPSLPLTAEPLSRTLDIVSVHVQGSTDPWSSKGTRLSKQYFNQKLVSIVRFKGGHEIPAKSQDVDNIACKIMVEYDCDSVPTAPVAPAMVSV
ncbi:unnamed protein product [Penicillium camemberti]|uniref:Str. FM013 n=1 Tax=Penicillium camemberti (strain FM 013) TaxID=1429867 RepID=A0A0G4PWX1_PENC3|nr:unnamed protein product [Penicillium camemberti]